MNPADFSFDDRVARRYNAQRAHPPDVSAAVGAAITEQAGGPGATVLEIGIGTGRIAWPVVDAGCKVVGIDLSANMLDEAFGEGRTFPDDKLHLLRADMHELPVADDTFDAVLAVHVMHLAKDWQVMLREVARVLKPNGVLIQGNDWIDPQSVVGRLRDELRTRVMALAPNFMPPSAGVSKQDFLAGLGATDTSEHIAAEWTVYASANDRLKDVEDRIDAESWILPPDLFAEVSAQLRAYAEATWPDMDEKLPVTRRFTLSITRGNWLRNE